MLDRQNLLDALLRLAPHDLEPDQLVPSARPAWHAWAACRGAGPAAFFPERGESPEPARAYCRRCPVMAECAAAGAQEVHGIWAGSSGRQRRQHRASEPLRRPALTPTARRQEVARLRAEGLSQTTIAQALGVHQTTVSADLRALRHTAA